MLSRGFMGVSFILGDAIFPYVLMVFSFGEILVLMEEDLNVSY